MFRLLWIYLVLPTWSELESKLPKTRPPVYHQQDAQPPPLSDVQGKKPIFFRDKEALSATAQQLWLAFEIKDVDYVTVLTTTTDDDDSSSSSSSETTTKVLWPDGTMQTDPVAILERINNEYNATTTIQVDLFKRVSKAVDNVRCNVDRFDPIFPRNTDSSLYAPYLFRKGQLTARDSHAVSLEETDEVLEEYEDGPFLCGDFVSAADCYWAPFLERYAAQLPLTHDGDAMEPRYGGRYEAIEEWFAAMEESIPCYSCRVAGDSVSWENVLKEAVKKGRVPKVELLPSRGKRVPRNRLGDGAKKLWDEYRRTRPYLCKTPQEECVAHIVRNRQQIVETLFAVSGDDELKLDDVEVDEALRETVSALLGNIEVSKMSGNARDVAAVLDTQLIRAPRDMGILAIAPLRALVTAAPKPRIKAN